MTAGVGIAARGANQGVMIVVTLVATRFLDPAAFGVFALAAAGVTLIRSLLHVGAFELLLKSPEPERLSRACLVVNFGLAVVLSIVLVGGAGLAAPLLKAPALFVLLLWMAPSNLFAAFTAWQEAQILRGQGVRRYYAVTIAGELVSGAAAVGLLMAGWGAMALVAQAYVRTLFLALGYCILQRPQFSGPVSAPVLNEVLRWSHSRYTAMTTNFISNYGADFVLGALLSPAATGLYRAGSRIATSVSDLFSQPAMLMATTSFSRRSANGLGSGDIWPGILLLLTAVGWPALAGLAVTAGELAPLILGPAWKGAGPVIAVLCIARAASLLTSVASPYLVTYDRQSVVLKVQIVTMVATVVGLFVTARFGVIAAVASVAAVQVASNLWLLWEVIKVSNPPRNLLLGGAAIAAGATLVTGGAAMAVLTLMPETVVRLPAAIGLGILGWGVIVLIARRNLMSGVASLNAAG